MTGSTKAHQRYRVNGTIVPGVTTVLNLLAKPALIYWAWNLGMQGEDYRKVSGKAADIGTIAHYMVECFLKAKEPDLDDYSNANIRKAKVAFGAFKEWWEGSDLKIIAVEEQMSSKRMLCGGTIDCIALSQKTGAIRLIDVKTSKGVYDEHKYQLAAYWAMWDENKPKLQIATAHIIQLDKLTGNSSFYTYDDLSVELEIFENLRRVYALKKSADMKRRGDRGFKTREN